MASNEDGSTPGGDVDATKTTATNNGDAAGSIAADKTKPGAVTADDTAGQVVFKDQAALDAVIEARVKRATKKLEDDAKLTKEQLLERERDDARRDVQERDLRDDFVAETGLDLAKGRRIFSMYKNDLEVNDSGKASNLTDVVKRAKKDFPELFATSKVQGTADGGKGGSATGGNMNDVLRRMAGRS
jgi:hypothetical protein